MTGAAEEPIVILVTGPPGSGKSTIAEAWARRRARCAVVDQDIVRRFVKGGFADPVTGWDEERLRQWALARELSVELARQYARSGFDCVLDAPYVPGPMGQRYGDSRWETLLPSVGARGPVVLLPDLETVQLRVAGREGVKLLPPPFVAAIYTMFEGWRNIDGAIVIDSSHMSIEDTVDALDGVVA